MSNTSLLAARTFSLYTSQLKICKNFLLLSPFAVDNTVSHMWPKGRLVCFLPCRIAKTIVFLTWSANNDAVDNVEKSNAPFRKYGALHVYMDIHFLLKQWPMYCVLHVNHGLFLPFCLFLSLSLSYRALIFKIGQKYNLKPEQLQEMKVVNDGLAASMLLLAIHTYIASHPFTQFSVAVCVWPDLSADRSRLGTTKYWCSSTLLTTMRMRLRSKWRQM